jgi:hypothetical protein
VIDATGQQGGAVVRALQASDQFKVRALTRNPRRHRKLAEEVVEVDLDRPETLEAAFADQTIASSPQFGDASSLGELLIRIVLIYTLSAVLVLIISPLMIGTLTIVTMIWAFSYGHRVRLRALSQLTQTATGSTP